MKSFSEYLLTYVTERRIAWRTAAKACDVERTLLRRYASGERMPENMEKVRKIAKGLGMSRQETEEFCELYQISRIGKYQYRAQRLIGRLFCERAIAQETEPLLQGAGCIDTETLSKKRAVFEMAVTAEGEQRCPVMRLYGREEIFTAAASLFWGASCLRIKMNFTGAAQCMLPLLFETKTDCRIEHMIEINNAGDGEAEIKEFEKLIPFLFSGRNYKIYCHYGWCREQEEMEKELYILLSDRGLILFTKNLTEGIFTNESGYREYYEEMLLGNERKCRVFGGSETAFLDEVDLQENVKCMENPMTGISFRYQNISQERIWVRRSGEKPAGFYLEEPELVKAFREYMRLEKAESK